MLINNYDNIVVIDVFGVLYFQTAKFNNRGGGRCGYMKKNNRYSLINNINHIIYYLPFHILVIADG